MTPRSYCGLVYNLPTLTAPYYLELVYNLPTLTAPYHLEIPTLRAVLNMNDERTGKQKGKVAGIIDFLVSEKGLATVELKRLGPS